MRLYEPTELHDELTCVLRRDFRLCLGKRKYGNLEEKVAENMLLLTVSAAQVTQFLLTNSTPSQR